MVLNGDVIALRNDIIVAISIPSSCQFLTSLHIYCSLVPRPSHPSVCRLQYVLTRGEKAWEQGYNKYVS